MTLIWKVLVVICLLLAGVSLACGGSDESYALNEVAVTRTSGPAGLLGADGSDGAPGPAGPRAAPAATAAPAPTMVPAATTAPAAQPTAAPAATPAPQRASREVAVTRVVTEEAEGEEAVSEGTMQSGGADVVASLPAQQRIIIRTVDMQLTVSDVAAAVDQVAALAGRSGGWVVSSDRSARHGGYISIRVPAGSLDSAVVRLRELALEVESEISTSQDVTDEYVDIQSRLKGLRATEDRLLEIMQQADKVEDALSVQLELSNLQTRIEQIEGRIKYLEQTSAYSLINIYLQASPLALPVNSGPDKTFAVGGTARFRATFQPPPGIDRFSWRWDFGDGSRPVEGSASAPTTNTGERITATVTHTYNDERDSPYIVEFTLTGTGESGLAEGEDTFIATVIKTPEIAVFAGESQVAEEGELVEFSGSFTHPEGLRDFRYRWDFGDGSPALEGVPTEGETQVTASHVYPNHRPNEYIVTLTVTAESDAGGVETAGYLGVHVRKSESLVISGWSLADAGRSAVRALSAVGYGIVTALLWLGVFIPVILVIAAAVYGLVWLRRRRERAGE